MLYVVLAPAVIARAVGFATIAKSAEDTGVLVRVGVLVALEVRVGVLVRVGAFVGVALATPVGVKVGAGVVPQPGIALHTFKRPLVPTLPARPATKSTLDNI